MSCFELCGEHIRLVSVGRHVDGALVDSLFFFAFNNQLGSAVNERNHRELLLGDRFIYLSRVLVPGSTFKLETKDVGTIFTSLKDLGDLRVPMESLLDVGLDVELVQTLTSLLSAHLLDSGQERVWLVEAVQETDGLVDNGGVILPHIKHLKALLHVVEP